MKRLLKSIADVTFRALPGDFRRRVLTFVLARQQAEAKLGAGVMDLQASLENVRRSGFLPRTIIDVGAYIGEWATSARGIFPASAVLMLEANAENEGALRVAAERLGPYATHRIALLGPESRADVAFNLMGTGSSVLAELTSIPRTQMKLPMMTLDSVVGESYAAPPFLLKLDVQGYELEVLRGAKATMRGSEVILLEVALLPYNESAPLFADVVEFMKDAGFVVYDFCGQHRRETDGAMFQVDVIFVREGSALLAPKPFWLQETA